ncbi:hypothetical protein [Microbacterium oleivorans]|uniref:Uncharacterized protein n=1 Tax=Microbacterium oleivorans TaxID=273677 RepID=A0A7D5EWW0_9MICO|nr:hypothetical protein [Microbacterium oleivorans]QLD11644.1 hypothetical protein HW566_07585 [Microbacterium oleivorans]
MRGDDVAGLGLIDEDEFVVQSVAAGHGPRVTESSDPADSETIGPVATL